MDTHAYAPRTHVYGCTYVSRHTRKFIEQLYEYVRDEDLIAILKIENANALGQIEQMVAICRKSLQKGMADDLGLALRDYQETSPENAKSILQRLDLKERHALKDYITL